MTTLRTARYSSMPVHSRSPISLGTEAPVHRSRLSVLVIVAAGAAACSTHDDTDGTAILSQDRTLVKALQNDQQTRPSALPDACTSVTVATQPASNRPEADVLTRRAYDAEMQGNVQE